MPQGANGIRANNLAAPSASHYSTRHHPHQGRAFQRLLKRRNQEEDGSLMQESSEWTKLEPDLNSQDADGAPTYSLQSEAGNYECSVSGLRWICNGKVRFTYQFCLWEEPMERMKSLQYMPAGPLMDITVVTGRFDEVYLPHWICIDDNPEILAKFAVLHIDDCGDDVEKVSQVTASHVKLSEPVFSPRGALVRTGLRVKQRCNVLIYKTNTAFLTLHVYLIPRDPGLQQEMDRKQISEGYTVIKKPHPNTSLKMNDRFILTAVLNGAEINPEYLKLRYERSSRSQDFFEVYSKNPDPDFELVLKRKKDHRTVWNCRIRKDEYHDDDAVNTTARGGSAAATPSAGAAAVNPTARGGSTEADFVEKHRAALIDKVTSVAPILDDLLNNELDCLLCCSPDRSLDHSPDRLLDRSSGLLRPPRQQHRVVRAQRASIKGPFVSRFKLSRRRRREVSKPRSNLPSFIVKDGQLKTATSNQQSVEVTTEVLKEMESSQSSSETSSASKGPSGSCDSISDSGKWTQVEPEVNRKGTDEFPTYSLQSEAGSFECSVSGLRWICKGKISFKYQFVYMGSCEVLMERIPSLQYMPAGPLMDITVVTGRFDEVYLPHWICIDNNPEILDKFAVLHVEDCGFNLEQVSQVTSSHVKLFEPSFSLKMVLVRIGFPFEVDCNVLIYKTNTAFLTLHLYLIPRDLGLLQELDRRMLSKGYKVIQKPRPETSLKIKDRFILTADLQGAEICPETLMLRYECTDPNFFEVFIESPETNFKLKLSKENEHQAVWTCAIRKNEYQSTAPRQAGAAAVNSTARGGSTEADFVDKHRAALIDRVTSVAPILDDLLDNEVVTQAKYDEIRDISTSRDQIRKLYSSLNAAGRADKEVFYKSLLKHEKPLMNDLQKNQ